MRKSYFVFGFIILVCSSFHIKPPALPKLRLTAAITERHRLDSNWVWARLMLRNLTGDTIIYGSEGCSRVNLYFTDSDNWQNGEFPCMVNSPSTFMLAPFQTDTINWVLQSKQRGQYNLRPFRIGFRYLAPYASGRLEPAIIWSNHVSPGDGLK